MANKIWKWFWHVRILRLRPGDVVIVRMKESLWPEEMDNLLKVLHSFFPDHHCLITDNDSKLEVVRHV